MKLSELFEKYLGFLWETFQYDTEVFSQGWIYYWLLIPAMFYLMFFCIKWAVLLFPFYTPFVGFSSTLIKISKIIAFKNLAKKK